MTGYNMGSGSHGHSIAAPPPTRRSSHRSYAGDMGGPSQSRQPSQRGRPQTAPPDGRDPTPSGPMRPSGQSPTEAFPNAGFAVASPDSRGQYSPDRPPAVPRGPAPPPGAMHPPGPPADIEMGAMPPPPPVGGDLIPSPPRNPNNFQFRRRRIAGGWGGGCDCGCGSGVGFTDLTWLSRCVCWFLFLCILGGIAVGILVGVHPWD